MNPLVITIARSYGSGGRTMGKLLAKDLGIDYYDRELIRLASDESGINESLFGAVDEQIQKKIQFKLFKKEGDLEILSPNNPDFISTDNLFNYQAKIIKELSVKSDCIIMGRCGNHILKDNPNVIRLYCYASLDACISREQSLSGLSDKDCIKKIHKIDKSRSDYYKYHTGLNWDDAKNYDLCINTASLSYEELLEVVKAYIKVFNHS